MKLSKLKKSKKLIICIAILLVSIALGLFQDLIHSKVNNYNFYLSESALYNSFWVFFIPFIWFQLKLYSKIYERLLLKMIISVALLTFTHLVVFAFFVNTISTVIFNYTFYVSQVLGYAMSNLLFIGILVYSSLSAFIYYRRENLNNKTTDLSTNETSYISTIPVVSGSKTVLVTPESILFITSERPYISIHTSIKRHLHSDSLKSFQKLLDPSKFFRIHKSTIVNIAAISRVTSRGNGDYDLHLKNDEIIRMSRNYSEDLKFLLKTVPA